MKKNPALQQLSRFLFLPLVLASEAIKVSYAFTCQCVSTQQPFTAWFFPAFHHLPWTFYWSYKGLVWLAGPYSVLWWVLNSPAYFGYYVFFPYILALDLAIGLLLFRKVGLFWSSLWFLFGVWFTGLDPVDFFIIAFTFLGRWKSGFLALAIATKLPLGSELFLGNFSVWQWVFTSSNSLSGVENWGRYLILGAFWLTSLSYRLGFADHIFEPIKKVAQKGNRRTGNQNSNQGSVRSLRENQGARKENISEDCSEDDCSSERSIQKVECGEGETKECTMP